MASEKDFELLDDYLSNRMNASDKQSFETRLKGDSELSRELKFQQQLTEGVRKARTAELKSFLNNIPVTSIPTSHTAATFTKAGLWVAGTAVVITASYLYFTADDKKSLTVEQPTEVAQPLTTPQENSVPSETEFTLAPSPSTEEVKKPGVVKKDPATKTETKPSIQAYDPSEEMDATEVNQYEKEQLGIISRAFVTSSIEVHTDHSLKEYQFHYAFKERKLLLYGEFDKNLYEILEFISDKDKTVVLYFKSNYYLLDLTKSTPTKLSPIKNQQLLKKLKEYRSK